MQGWDKRMCWVFPMLAGSLVGDPGYIQVRKHGNKAKRE